MIDIKYGHHVLFLGATGEGKTVGMQWLYSLFPRTVVYDLEDYDNWEHIHKRVIVTSNPGNLQKLLDVVNKENTPEIHIVYKPKDNLVGEALTEDFNAICIMLFHSTNLAFFCDELGNATGLQPMDSTAPPGLVQILTRGRRRSLSMVGASQRNQNIPKVMIAQSRHRFIYRLDGYDANAYKGYIQNINQVLTLQPYFFLYQYQGKSTLMNPVPRVIAPNNEVVYYD